MAQTIRYISFFFVQGTVTWKPNDDATQTPKESDRPFKWIVYVDNTKKWFSNMSPNVTQAKRYLKNL
jgi:hypothetical protein